MPIGSTSFPGALDDLSTLVEQHDGFVTTLTADLTAGAISLTCADTSGASATGVIVIEGEEIGYTSKDATHLLGLTRGLFQTLG